MPLLLPSPTTTLYPSALRLGSGKKMRSKVKASLLAQNISPPSLVSEPSSTIVTEGFRSGRRNDSLTSSSSSSDNLRERNDSHSFGPNVDLNFSLHENDDESTTNSATLQDQFLDMTNAAASMRNSMMTHDHNISNSQERHHTGELPELEDDSGEFSNGDNLDDDEDLDEDMKLAIRMSISEAQIQKRKTTQLAGEDEDNDELALALRLSTQSITKEEEDLAAAIRLSQIEHNEQELEEKQQLENLLLKATKQEKTEDEQKQVMEWVLEVVCQDS